MDELQQADVQRGQPILEITMSELVAINRLLKILESYDAVFTMFENHDYQCAIGVFQNWVKRYEERSGMLLTSDRKIRSLNETIETLKQELAEYRGVK